MIGSNAKANAANAVLLRIGGLMSAGRDVGNEERAIRQFHRFAVTVGVVHEEPMIFGGSNPGLAAVGAEDDALSTGPIRTVQTHQCAITQHGEAWRKHSHAERHRLRPRFPFVL